jgi:hypothetical protein
MSGLDNDGLYQHALDIFRCIFDCCIGAADALSLALRKADIILPQDEAGDLSFDLSLFDYVGLRRIMLFLYCEPDIRTFLDSRPEIDFGLPLPYIEAVAVPLTRKRTSAEVVRDNAEAKAKRLEKQDLAAAKRLEKEAKVRENREAKAAQKVATNKAKADAVDSALANKLSDYEKKLSEMQAVEAAESAKRQEQAFESGLNLHQMPAMFGTSSKKRNEGMMILTNPTCCS